jgi:hypothetical protein
VGRSVESAPSPRPFTVDGREWGFPMTVCEYDSGLMFGNVPLCSSPASFTVTYRNGSIGPFTVAVCERHLSATRGRVYPSAVEVAAVAR